MVNACIERDANGTHRVICKRAKYKHWHELGKHRETDIAFEQALKDGTVLWNPAIEDKTRLFHKI